MNLSLFIHQYLDFRLSYAPVVELYLIDQIQEGQFEILIKDNGESLKDDELESAKSKIEKLNLSNPNKYYQYYHKGKNNLQIELRLQKTKFSLPELNNTISFLMVQFPEREIVFTYLSPKGEYLLNSKDFISKFKLEEVQSKEFALYLNELLQNQLDEVIFSHFVYK